MAAQPYVGVTGPVNITEVEKVLDIFENRYDPSRSIHIPMMGFLVSYKTLNGMPTENRRYPPVSELRPLFQETSGHFCLPMIHYNTREQETLAEQVGKIFEEIYDCCQALQLNVVWPDAGQVRKVKDNFPEMKTVLQFSRSATAGRNIQEISEKVKEYGDAISYALIDPSGGKGQEFSMKDSLELYNTLRNEAPNVTIGFAGGFSGENVEKRVREIIAKTGSAEFCIDAEGGLRDKLSDKYGDDLLSMEKVRAYVEGAGRVLL